MLNDDFNPYEYHDLESEGEDSSVKPFEFEEGEITDREPRTPIEIFLARQGFVSNERVVMTVHRNYCEVSGNNLDEPFLIARDEAEQRIKITDWEMFLRNAKNKRLRFKFKNEKNTPLLIARLQTWVSDDWEQDTAEACQKVFQRLKRRIFYPVFHGMTLITVLCFSVTALAVGIVCTDPGMPMAVRMISSSVYLIPFVLTLLLTIGLWKHTDWALPVGFFLSLIPTILSAAASILIFPILFFVLAAAVSWSFYKGWRDNERLTEILQRDNDNRQTESEP